MKIVFIVQRYGTDFAGGSEALCRLVAERLSKYHEIEILTTCAKDYITWRNEYREGCENINGIKVRRFSVDRERDLQTFHKSTQEIFSRTHGEIDELRWIEAQGPYSPKLVKFIKTHADDFDIFVFFTYRYYPTFFGLPYVFEKSILVPTAENESTLDLKVLFPFFCLPRAFIFLTKEEKHLLMQRFPIQKTDHDVIGMGLSIPENIDCDRFRAQYQLYDDYIVYIGRIDKSKGCDKLFEFFLKYKRENRSQLKLVLIGKDAITIPNNPDIIFLGFLSEREKYEAIKAAKILVMPSELESYSIVVTESLALGTPVLVNERCAVLKGHCKRSQAGLYYSNYNEFSTCITRLLSDDKLRENIRENGKRYIEKNYQWDLIETKYLKTFELFSPITT